MVTKNILNSALANVLLEDINFIRKQVTALAGSLKAETVNALPLENFEEVKQSKKYAVSYLMSVTNDLLSELRSVTSELTLIKKESTEERRNYDSGFAIGIGWGSSYRPGGPYWWDESRSFSPDLKEKARQSKVNNKAWLQGFDEGYAIKKSIDPSLSELIR